MPEDITKLDLMKLLMGLEMQSPGVQVFIQGDVTINVHQTQNNDASTTVNETNIQVDYSFIDTLNLTAEGKKDAKGLFEKFAGTLKSYKEGSEGLVKLIADCAKYGPAAIPMISQATQILQQYFPG